MLKAIGRALAGVWRQRRRTDLHRSRDERAAAKGMWDGHSGPGI
jgi:hypothetical protein